MALLSYIHINYDIPGSIFKSNIVIWMVTEYGYISCTWNTYIYDSTINLMSKDIFNIVINWTNRCPANDKTSAACCGLLKKNWWWLKDNELNIDQHPQIIHNSTFEKQICLRCCFTSAHQSINYMYTTLLIYCWCKLWFCPNVCWHLMALSWPK